MKEVSIIGSICLRMCFRFMEPTALVERSCARSYVEDRFWSFSASFLRALSQWTPAAAPTSEAGR